MHDSTISSSGSNVIDEPHQIGLHPQLLPPHPSDGEVQRLLAKYPVPDNTHYSYGTAGFRLAHEMLPPVMVRVALVAVLECWQQHDGDGDGTAVDVGVMITASHNDESYNGIKIAAGPDGGMLHAEGEARAVQITNERDANVTWQLFQQARRQQAQQHDNDDDAATTTIVPTVHVGRDTRAHSPALACLLIKVVRAAGARVLDHGVVTTPMLHHCVRHGNNQLDHSRVLVPPRPNVGGYMDLLCHSYLAMLATIPPLSASTSQTPPASTLLVDCAGGVGYPALQQLTTTLSALTGDSAAAAGFGRRRTHIVATNAPGLRHDNEGSRLNHSCGSEHVQKTLTAPTWYDDDGALSHDKSYCAALDGDADRVVFFAAMAGNDLMLLDGDKIAALLCDFVQHELAQLHNHVATTTTSSLQLGVVQTAYANGASTQYLHQLLGPTNVIIAKTGVKHVHAAAEKFDVGVYFEANGHGTIVLGRRFYELLQTMDTTCLNARARVAWRRLSILPSLINQAVGDALSDLLLVDAILHIHGWTLRHWHALYTDLPSRQVTVQVQDRHVIVTNDNETHCIAPAMLQPALDAAMALYPHGRVFVRPSGTEDVVRVYAEAATIEAAQALAQQACVLVYQHCQGVGEMPQLLLPLPAARM